VRKLQGSPASGRRSPARADDWRLATTSVGHVGVQPSNQEPDGPIIPPQYEARQLLERSRRLLDQMHAEDREAAIELHEKIETAIDAGSGIQLQAASQAFEELMFFVEGPR